MGKLTRIVLKTPTSSNPSLEIAEETLRVILNKSVLPESFRPVSPIDKVIPWRLIPIDIPDSPYIPRPILRYNKRSRKCQTRKSEDGEVWEHATLVKQVIPRRHPTDQATQTPS